MLYRAPRGRAFLEGRSFPTPDDFKSLAIPVLAHRLVGNARYASTRKASEQADEMLRDILETVPVPV